MKLLTNRVLKTFLFLLTVTFLVEIIFKIGVENPILDWSTVRIFIGAVVLSSLFALLLSFCKKWIRNTLTIILSLIVTIYAIAQAGFFNYLGTYMSLSTSSQAGAVMDFVEEFVKSLKWQYYLILIPFILLVIFYILFEKKITIYEQNLEINYLDKIRGKKKKEAFLEEQAKKKKKTINLTRYIFLGVLVVSIGLYYVSITAKFMQNEIQIVSNKELFKNPSIPNIAVSQYGVVGYGILDVKSLIFPVDQDEEEEELIVVNNPGNTEKKENENTRKIDDTEWQALNESETNKDYKKLNTYFMSKTITDKNEYTGVLKGKNLILIMLESGSNVIFDYPEYFPNFAKLYNESWVWENAFSPRNACSTGNNEMTGITSLHTINQNCTANIYKSNTYFESIFNLFNKEGYTTTSFHDYDDHYYYRHEYHPNMGSQKYRGVYEIGIRLGSEYQPWPSDVDFIEKAYPMFSKDEKYMTWLTTVSGHMKYSYSSVTGDKYLSTFKNEKWDIQAKRYMSKLKIDDEAMGLLLKKLEDDGTLKDTVIMLYADHEPYGLDPYIFKTITKYSIAKNGDVDRTPFIIYNPELTPTKRQEYTSFINIVPTLANLFDLDYDPRLYGGTDLLSSDYLNVVAFADGSWRSDKAYYDASTGKMTYLTEEQYSPEEIQRINASIKNEMSMDNLAIKTNYFEYLNKKLKKGFVVGTKNTDIKKEITNRETKNEEQKQEEGE